MSNNVSTHSILIKDYDKTTTFAILTCTAKKIFDKYPNIKQIEAKNAYIGPVFKLAKQFCELNNVPYIILSAKYGFLLPTDQIENYNISFRMKNHPDIITNEKLFETFERCNSILKLNQNYKTILSFAISDDYQMRIKLINEKYQFNLVTPIAKKTIGYALQTVKNMIDIKL